MSAISLVSNPIFYSPTKHIELDVHFIRDKLLKKEIEVWYVPSQDQIVDSLTKAVTLFAFFTFKAKLYVQQAPTGLRGDFENEEHMDNIIPLIV